MASDFRSGLHVLILVRRDVLECGVGKHHLACVVPVEPVISLQAAVNKGKRGVMK